MKYAFATIVVAVVVYMSSYFILSSTGEGYLGVISYRDFPSKHMWRPCWPLGWIESRIRGQALQFTTDDAPADALRLIYTPNGLGPIFDPDPDPATPYRVHGGVI